MKKLQLTAKSVSKTAKSLKKAEIAMMEKVVEQKLQEMLEQKIDIPVQPIKDGLALTDIEAKEFETLALQYSKSKEEENKLKGANQGMRTSILEKMGSNNEYIGQKVDITISPVKNESINAVSVIDSMIDINSSDLETIKKGINQIRDLARLGLVEISKTAFEKYAKANGIITTGFIVSGTPEKRLKVEAKVFA